MALLGVVKSVFEIALNELRQNKSPGMDRIQADILKFAREQQPPGYLNST